MLSTFEAKGKMGAKQLKEQLHLGWPVPDSRAALGQLRKDLQDEMRQSLEVVCVCVCVCVCLCACVCVCLCACACVHLR